MDGIEGTRWLMKEVLAAALRPRGRRREALV